VRTESHGYLRFRWSAPSGSRHLAVKIDRVVVDSALETLLDGSVDAPIPFNAVLPLKAGAAQDWVPLSLAGRRRSVMRWTSSRQVRTFR
jgi:hypothetical protein